MHTCVHHSYSFDWLSPWFIQSFSHLFIRLFILQNAHFGGKKTRKRTLISEGKGKCITKNERTESSMKSLCTECQWVTKLPETKFPRYLNELICGESADTRHVEFCTNGICIQEKMYQDLLQHTNKFVKVISSDPSFDEVYKQVWDPYTQEIRSCCECQQY